MIITRTPFRISFTGGGTDLPGYYKKHGGAVVSSGINKYMYITVNPKFDNRIRVSYSKTEMVDTVEELQHDIVKEALKLVGIRGGIEITSIGDIPAGTGLGSSSTFAVGLLNALHTFVGSRPSAEELAEQACQIEIDILKHPIGKQDQYAAAFGGTNYFRFNADGTVDRTRIFLDEHNARLMRQRLMLFYTGITRSANNVLSRQNDNTDANMPILDFMAAQAASMKDVLLNEGFNEKFGKMLHEGWMHKMELADGIANDEIMDYYNKAIEAGAVGGKLLGAGGGGFLLFYCDEEKQPSVERAVGLRRVDFHPELNGTRVLFYS
ncbi:MAG: GHMP kinase [Lachnospiraceae bacterium]|nr:GHMP kinase [Lachnospiraceae bacterium]